MWAWGIIILNRVVREGLISKLNIILFYIDHTLIKTKKLEGSTIMLAKNISTNMYILWNIEQQFLKRIWFCFYSNEKK